MFEESFRLDMLDDPIRQLVIHCPDEDLAKELISLLYEHGIRWYSNNPNDTYWEDYEQDTCYFVERTDRLLYGNLDYVYSELKGELRGYITCVYRGIDSGQDFGPAGEDDIQKFLAS